eukprot:sb/3475264/
MTSVRARELWSEHWPDRMTLCSDWRQTIVVTVITSSLFESTAVLGVWPVNVVHALFLIILQVTIQLDPPDVDWAKNIRHHDRLYHSKLESNLITRSPRYHYHTNVSGASHILVYLYCETTVEDPGREK